MIYQLSEKRDKTSAKGTVYVSATLTDESGVEYVGVNAFRGEFAGETFTGDLEKNGNFYNLVTPKAVASGNFKNLQTEKLMEKKEQSIRGFQDNKEQSIKIASTLGKAVDMAIAEYANPKSLYTLEELVEKYRRWLWLEWDNVSDYPPFK